MGKSRVIPPREQTRAEEVANSVSHGIALAAALVGTPFLVLQAISYPSAGFIVGGSIFATTTVLLYILMGWVVLIAIEPLSARLPAQGLLWLVAGGVAYTAGVVFYATGARLRYGHFIYLARDTPSFRSGRDSASALADPVLAPLFVRLPLVI